MIRNNIVKGEVKRQNLGKCGKLCKCSKTFGGDCRKLNDLKNTMNHYSGKMIAGVMPCLATRYAREF